MLRVRLQDQEGELLADVSVDERGAIKRSSFRTETFICLSMASCRACRSTGRCSSLSAREPD
jgi:hypothetical protein